MNHTKKQILDEIKRTAAENGGIPLGSAKFAAETGIRLSDCVGVYWTRWSEALAEAGLKPNQMNGSYDKHYLLRKYAELVLELNKIPVKAEIQLKCIRDSKYPHHTTFYRSFGSIRELHTQLVDYCGPNPQFEAVKKLCKQKLSNTKQESTPRIQKQTIKGYVYLIKHGTRREFKIGRTSNALRREGEISIELPEKVLPVHVMATDDPVGIEAYWHKRFALKRKNGEWFELSAEDVAAFRRRKYM